MSKTKMIIQEDIVKGAFALARESGMSVVNARSVAQYLRCSTKPIYSCFSGMPELRDAVMKRAIEQYHSFVEAYIKNSCYPPYKAQGMGYIQFAKQEPQLFQLLFMRDRSQEGMSDETEHLYQQMVDIVMPMMHLTRSAAERFHLEMWMFVHGIACLQTTAFLDMDEETVSELITEAYQSLYARFTQEQAKNAKGADKK